MPAVACSTPSPLLQAASRWEISAGSTLVAFGLGGVGHSKPLGWCVFRRLEPWIEMAICQSKQRGLPRRTNGLRR